MCVVPKETEEKERLQLWSVLGEEDPSAMSLPPRGAEGDRLDAAWAPGHLLPLRGDTQKITLGQG